MFKFKLKKIVDLMIVICFLAIVFFVPLFCALFYRTANVFELNKMVLFKILVLLLLLSTFLKFLLGGYGFGSFRLKRPAYKIFIPPVLFLLALALASFFSANRMESIFGSYARQQGLISYGYYFLFFLLTIININTDSSVQKVLRAISLSSLIVSLYGIMQSLGYDPVVWSESIQLRVTSTLGQPNFLGIYLAMVAPVSLYLAYISKQPASRYFYCAILALNLICLFFTYSISSWAGFIAASLFTAISYIYFNRDWINITSAKAYLAKKKKIAGIVALIFILFFSGFGYFIAHSQNRYMLSDKLDTITNLREGSMGSRFYFWEAAWSAIKARPWLGYGLETQPDVLSAYYQKDWALYENVNVVPDRAHNIFLDLLLTAGIIGLLAYLGFIYFIFRTIRKILKERSADSNLGYAALFAFIAYFTSMQLNFAFITGEVYFWLFLAFIVGLGYKRKSEFIENTVIKNNNIILSLKIIVVSLVIFATGFLVNNQIKILLADSYYFELQLAKYYNQYFSAIKMYEFIKEELPAYGYYDQKFAFMMSEWVGEIADARMRKYGEDKLAVILPLANGNNNADILTAAKINIALANSDNLEDFVMAEKKLLELAEKSPNKPDIYAELMGLYAKKGDEKKALEYYSGSIERMPDPADPRINTTHQSAIKHEIYRLDLIIGDMYLHTKNYISSEMYYKNALELDPKIIDAYQKLADLYLKTDDKKQAIWYNEKVVEMDPANYKANNNLANIYKKIGNEERAVYYKNKAAELTPF